MIVRSCFAARAWSGGLLAFALAVGTLGCSESTDARESPRLRVIALTIAGQTLEAEVAVTPEEQARGLMFRESLAENAGMLFVFEAPRRASFWMRNTRIPLSIAYLTADGTVAEIHELQPFNERAVASRSEDIAYALEVNQGWFRKHRIAPGDRIQGLEAVRQD